MHCLRQPGESVFELPIRCWNLLYLIQGNIFFVWYFTHSIWAPSCFELCENDIRIATQNEKVASELRMALQNRASEWRIKIAPQNNASKLHRRTRNSRLLLGPLAKNLAIVAAIISFRNFPHATELHYFARDVKFNECICRYRWRLKFTWKEIPVFRQGTIVRETFTFLRPMLSNAAQSSARGFVDTPREPFSQSVGLNRRLFRR